jgi:hypothetical protein
MFGNSIGYGFGLIPFNMFWLKPMKFLNLKGLQLKQEAIGSSKVKALIEINRFQSIL